MDDVDVKPVVEVDGIDAVVVVLGQQQTIEHVGVIRRNSFDGGKAGRLGLPDCPQLAIDDLLATHVEGVEGIGLKMGGSNRACSGRAQLSPCRPC